MTGHTSSPTPRTTAACAARRRCQRSDADRGENESLFCVRECVEGGGRGSRHVPLKRDDSQQQHAAKPAECATFMLKE
eukprot:159820-Chlamydomonas_euryale.AAC.10